MTSTAERDLASDLALAHRLANTADTISLARFQARDLVVDIKADRTPVTEADRSIEEAMRSLLEGARPDDAVLGEEFGGTGAASRRWLLDPIDSTKNYLRGIPVFATLIALAVDEQAVVGMVSAPALHRRWWAARRKGAFLNGDPIRVSAISRLERAQLSYSDLRTFAYHGYREGAEQLAGLVWRVRGFGDFWSHVMVAEGAVDVAAEPSVNAWDLAALQVIVEEAGGRFSDLKGRPRFDGGSALSTNGILHDEVLALFEARG